MDHTEEIANKHLLARFPGENRINYEPDGNIPPDFLIDNNIAIEVRRLNEHDNNLPVPRGLEEAEKPLIRLLRQNINFNTTNKAKTFGITLHFGRPLPDKRSIELGIDKLLNDIVLSENPEELEKEIAPRIFLRCAGEIPFNGNIFRLIGWYDDDQGGTMLSILLKNISICINNKTEKVRPYRNKYPIWWLLLVDNISAGKNDYIRTEYRNALRISHNWDRVILLDPSNVDSTLEF
jgi:hypothetical protein